MGLLRPAPPPARKDLPKAPSSWLSSHFLPPPTSPFVQKQISRILACPEEIPEGAKWGVGEVWIPLTTFLPVPWIHLIDFFLSSLFSPQKPMVACGWLSLDFVPHPAKQRKRPRVGLNGAPSGCSPASPTLQLLAVPRFSAPLVPLQPRLWVRAASPQGPLRRTTRAGQEASPVSPLQRQHLGSAWGNPNTGTWLA